MLTFTLILFLIACGGFIFSIIQIIRNAIKKQDNKSNKKILIGCVVLAIVAIALPTGSSSKEDATKTVVTQNQEKTKENKNELTSSDKELLKKHYKDFDVKEKTQFAEIEEKYNKMSDTEKEQIKADFQMILKEQDIQVAEWEKKEQKQKEIDSYKANARETCSKIGDEWNKASNIMSKGLEVYTQENTIKLATSFVIIKEYWKELREKPVPDSMKDTHVKLLEVAKLQEEAIDLCTKGIDNTSPDLLEQGNSKLNRAIEIFNSIKLALGY